MRIESIMQNGSIVSYSGMLAKQGLNNDRSMSILASLIFLLSTVFDVVQPEIRLRKLILALNEVGVINVRFIQWAPLS